MKYTAEQIKPKRYPDEKPSEDRAYVNYRVLLDNGTQSLFNWNPISQSDGKMIWNKYVTWFIDIPNPPEELRFLAYPENKPEQDGEYWVHNKVHDKWDVHFWSGNYFTNLVSAYWDNLFDYFIPYRLDEPVSDTDELDEPLGNSEQLEREDKVTYKPKDKFSDYTDEELLLELINRNVMFEAPKKTERLVRHYEVFVDIGDDNTASIILPQDSLFKLREIVYDEQSSNPCQSERDNEMELKILVDWRKDKDMVNLNTGRVTKDDFRTICTQFLDAEGYDVAKREPEWLPCPNPECRCKRAVYIDVNTIDSLEGDYTYYSVLCDGCGYCGPEAKTPQEAIRLHNLIAKNAKRSSLCEPENEYYGLCCDEDGNVLPRKES